LHLDYSWYAVQVKPKYESVAAKSLRAIGYDEFLPTVTVRSRWSDRVKEIHKPLFPHYVFCRLGAEVLAPILTVTGVVRIVGFGGKPAPIPDHEIEALRRVLAQNLNVESHLYVEVGEFVVVTSGPLRGVQGLVKAVKSADRLILSVGLLMRSVAVQLDGASVAPLMPSSPEAVGAQSVMR
jgi:transcription antitermination factor NusG